MNAAASLVFSCSCFTRACSSRTGVEQQRQQHQQQWRGQKWEAAGQRARQLSHAPTSAAEHSGHIAAHRFGSQGTCNVCANTPHSYAHTEYLTTHHSLTAALPAAVLCAAPSHPPAGPSNKKGPCLVGSPPAAVPPSLNPVADHE